MTEHLVKRCFMHQRITITSLFGYSSTTLVRAGGGLVRKHEIRPMSHVQAV
jgi:hypothetical protein